MQTSLIQFMKDMGDDDTNINDHIDLTFSENINISKCLFKNRPLGIAINPSNTSKKHRYQSAVFMTIKVLLVLKITMI